MRWLAVRMGSLSYACRNLPVLEYKVNTVSPPEYLNFLSQRKMLTLKVFLSILLKHEVNL